MPTATAKREAETRVAGKTEASFARSAAEIAENSKYLAGGVSSNFRLGMAGGPLVFQAGDGPSLIDVDGNRLID